MKKIHITNKERKWKRRELRVKTGVRSDYEPDERPGWVVIPTDNAM